MASGVRVTALCTTPVKGLRIARRERIALERGGARGDRRFYLIDDRGRMINGKHSGALNEIVARLDGGDTETLTLSFPDGSEASGAIELGEAVATRFFSRPREALLVRGELSRAISEHVGERLRLVRAADGSPAVDRGAGGAVSLVSGASLAALAEVAGLARVDARRFRMTIELDGVAPFEEDGWIGRRLRVGEALIRPRGHVGRCIVTSRDPDTGAVDLPTLDLLRSFRAAAPTSEPLALGIFGEVLQPGVVALGDAVTVEADGAEERPARGGRDALRRP